MVSSPSVTVPSDAEISVVFRVHIVLEFTAPSNRHLKHVCTPPSTVSTSKLAEILKVSMHPVCELPVEKVRIVRLQVHESHVGLGKKELIFQQALK